MTRFRNNRRRLSAPKAGQRKRFSVNDKIVAWKDITEKKKSVRQVAREFGVRRHIVQRWRQQLHKAKNAAVHLEEFESRKFCYTFHKGYKPKCAQLDEALLEYFRSEREKGNAVTKAIMVTKYRELDPEGTATARPIRSNTSFECCWPLLI